MLAALTHLASGLGCNMRRSSAGAHGLNQFIPAKRRHWGMDASGDGKASPYDARDAVYSSARYLRASGAPKSYRRALFAYNHANWYVNQVLALSRRFRTAGRVERAASAPGEPLAARGLPREQTALPRS